jgi:hypothetical protein
VARNGNATQVEVILSAPAQPKVIVANDPPRLVLELADTSARAKQRQIPVGQDGIKAIRIGLHSATPPVTRIVVDLETPRPYGLAMEGNRVVLTVLPAVTASHGGSGAPGAAGVPLFGRLHSHKRPPPSLADTVIPAPVPPAPPSGPPITIAQTAPTSIRSAAPVSRPTAAHPNYGSLQEGTVFPTMGQPGTGVVPSTVDSSTNNAQQIAAAAQKSGQQSAAQAVTGGSQDTQVKLARAESARADKAQVKPMETFTAVQRMTVTAPAQSAPAAVTTVSIAGSGSSNVTGVQSAPLAAPVLPAASATKAVPSSMSAPTSVQHATVATAVQPTPVPVPAASPAKSAIADTKLVVSPTVSATAASEGQGSKTVSNSGTTAVAALTQASNPTSTPSSTGSATVPGQAITAGVERPASAVSAAPIPVAPTASTSSGKPTATTIMAEAIPPPAAVAESEVPVPILATRQPNADLRTAYKVKYVAEGAAYLDAGRSSGLSEGMKLQILDKDSSTAQAQTNDTPGVRVVADLKVISVADNSAVAEISEPTRDVKAGDLAYLSTEDTESLVAQRSLSPTRKYPTVISFTEGDPLEEEARDEVPRLPLPEVNRARGRIGFDYSGIVSHGTFSSTSSNLGMVIRTDVTRIGGSYWNMDGYWRGRFTSNSGASQTTLQDLMNRTYTLGLTYQNPQSAWVAGVGRLYLPWATSLDTLDGGYIGRRVSDIATVGVFAGSTPDPLSWSYAPDQQISGMFVNFQGGSFDDVHYSSTSGMGLQLLKWKINRPFAFFENGFYYKRLFSIYNALQADKPASNPAVTSPGSGIARSFTTLRIQPFDRLEFDVNHTYFRDVPNFDPQLIGTGLLDKYLFQGFSAGPRVEVMKDIWVYATLGKSNRSGETKSSLNQLYGVTFNDLPFRFHADIRYSRFNSSFGDGDYKAISISRNFRESFRWEVLVGQQSYSSTLATSDRSKFVNANIEAPLGPHYFVQGGWTVNRGGTLDYDQWFTTFGYRFDSWHRGAK